MLTQSDVRRLSGALIALWLLGLSGATYIRASVWQSELSLWSAAVAVTPNKPRPWINLGLAREVAKDLPGAFAAQQTAFALAFQPRLTQYQQKFSYIASQTNIARMLAQTGHEAEAERILVQVVQRAPTFPHAIFNLAVLYARTGRCPQGVPLAQVAHHLDASFGELVCQ